MKFRDLKPDEIDCRIARVTDKAVMLLLYKDARVDMNILDETVGPLNWQRKHEVIGGNLFCSVGIYDPDKKEWIWKQDVGVESYTEKEKGQASDAFKRACFNIGIGRELYTAPTIWVYQGNFNNKDGKCYDKFKVKDIQITDKKITALTIINENKNNAEVYAMGSRVENPAEVGARKITAAKVKTLETDIENGVIDKDKLLKWFKVKKLADITEAQYTDYQKKKAAKK